MHHVHKFTDKDMVSPDFTPRRATRNRTKPKKYDEYLDMTPVKRKTYNYIESSDEDLSQETALKSKGIFTFFLCISYIKYEK